MSPRTLPCPNCGELADASTHNHWRPFCSRRCKLIDLGDWLSEEHRIPEADPKEQTWDAPDSDSSH